MTRRKGIVWVVLALLVASVTGCGPITAATVVQKGGMWLAKEAVKKGYKELKEKHDQDKAAAGEDEMSSERRHDDHHRSKHHD